MNGKWIAQTEIVFYFAWFCSVAEKKNIAEAKNNIKIAAAIVGLGLERGRLFWKLRPNPEERKDLTLLRWSKKETNLRSSAQTDGEDEENHNFLRWRASCSFCTDPLLYYGHSLYS